MIFKTFNSDIDNMSSRWGMFGKSFSDIGDTITTKWKQVTDYIAGTNNATISGMMSAWKGTSPVQFLSDDSVVNIISDYNKALDKGAEATAKFFEVGTGNDFIFFHYNFDISKNFLEAFIYKNMKIDFQKN